jgi:hypothetical protein
MEAFSAQLSAPVLQMAGGDMAANDQVQIRDIQGLGPVKADVSSTALATARGEHYQGSSVGKRNIMLTLGLNPDWAVQDMAVLRQQLYSYFIPQQWCKLRFFSSHLPVVEIEGICEDVQPNIFSQDPELEISILSHKPDFVDADPTLMDGVLSDVLTQLPFTYTGQVSTGFELTVKATAPRPNYTGGFNFILQSPSIPQTFELLTPVTVDATQYLKLTTIQGRRRIQNIRVADGVATNLMNKMAVGSVWPEILPGANELTIGVNAGLTGQKFQFAYFNRYAGL